MRTFEVCDHDFKTPNWRSGRHVPCVAVAIMPKGVAVRSTKDKSKTTLFFGKGEWRAFVKGVQNGEFELPGPRRSVAPWTCVSTVYTKGGGESYETLPPCYL